MKYIIITAVWSQEELAKQRESHPDKTQEYHFKLLSHLGEEKIVAPPQHDCLIVELLMSESEYNTWYSSNAIGLTVPQEKYLNFLSINEAARKNPFEKDSKPQSPGGTFSSSALFSSTSSSSSSSSSSASSTTAPESRRFGPGGTS